MNLEKETARNSWVASSLGIPSVYRDDVDFVAAVSGVYVGFFVRDENEREVLIENFAPHRTIEVPVEFRLGVA